MKSVDAELLRIQQVIEADRQLNSDLTLMVFSDHGMAERVGGPADNRTGAINILDYVNATDFERVVGSKMGPVTQLWPKFEQEDWVFYHINVSKAI